MCVMSVCVCVCVCVCEHFNKRASVREDQQQLRWTVAQPTAVVIEHTRVCSHEYTVYCSGLTATDSSHNVVVYSMSA